MKRQDERLSEWYVPEHVQEAEENRRAAENWTRPLKDKLLLWVFMTVSIWVLGAIVSIPLALLVGGYSNLAVYFIGVFLLGTIGAATVTDFN